MSLAITDVYRNGPVFPSKVNKCPASMFAANRTANIAGRIIFLIVSIHTINMLYYSIQI